MTYQTPQERRDKAWLIAKAITENESDTPETSALIVQWRILAELADLNDNLENIASSLDRIPRRYDQ